MSAGRPTVYVAPSRGVVAGAVFLHVPVAYQPTRLVAASVVSSGLVQIEPDFERAWRSAPPSLREVGVPTLAPAKPRPIVVLAVGAAEEDSWHRDNVWLAPRYSQKEYQRARQPGRAWTSAPDPACELGCSGRG